MSIYATRIVIGDEDNPIGRVRAYRASHQYVPGPDVIEGIETAHVPGFCVPGHGDDPEDSGGVGEWLRLSVGPHSVLIDSAAARELGRDLVIWASLPKVVMR